MQECLIVIEDWCDLKKVGVLFGGRVSTRSEKLKELLPELIISEN